MTRIPATPRIAAWFSTPNFAGLEIIARAGYDTVIFDAEHGTFELQDLDRAIPFAKALGLTCLVKTYSAERAPIQQALDFGADGVVIPHVLGAEHAREVCGYAKLPPLGDRSLAGGRTMNYGGFNADWAAEQDAAILCLPMIEDVTALDEVEAILALDTVDGIFVGPGDLAIRRGSGGFQRSEGDLADIRRMAQAAQAAGKHWMLPAWSTAEQDLGLAEGAHTIAVLQEFAALRQGFESALSAIRAR